MIYFAYGASGFASIAESFWIKEECTELSAVALAVIGFWIGIPWTIKMVFGQFIDSIRIFGSGRKIYVFIGAGLIAAGQLIMVGLAAKSPWLLQFGTMGKLYLIASVIAVIGFVLQDATADTMSTEVVDRFNQKGEPKPQEEIDTELAQVQWLGRVALMLAGVAVAGLGGWIAQICTYTTVFSLALFIPAISVLSTIFVRLNPIPKSPINWWVLGGGLSFAGFVVSIGYLEIPYAQEIVFAVSLSVVTFLISRIGITKPLIFAAIVIFIFRAIPGAGPGVGWWMIDVLGFDKAFQGTLSQIAAILGITGLFVFRKYIVEKPLGFTLAWLTIAGAIVSLPTIAMFYKVHEMIGVSARTVALVDTTIAAPLGQLSMVPLLTIVARSCPSGQAGTWFALMASLMNLALS
ncbi:MAG: hypothetical protein Q8N81_00110, partial [bacterium]|nr:hypothetical protein [bacterium]